MTYTIYPPFHLLRSWEACWKCGGGAEAIAFAAASATSDDEEEQDEMPEHSPIILRDIEQAPPAFIVAADLANGRFKKRYSHTAAREYYMNHCTCGAPFGDHFLHNEPGHAFYPTDTTEAASIKIQEIDYSDELEIDCGFAGWSSLCPFEFGVMEAGKITVPLE